AKLHLRWVNENWRLALVTSAVLVGAACTSSSSPGGGSSLGGNGTATGSSGAAGGSGALGGASGLGGAGTGNVAAGVGGATSAGMAGAAPGGSGGGGSAGTSAGPQPQRPRRTADEVLLVSNSNSAVSMAIAQDYASKRNIKNVLSISCADSATSPDQETIE